MHRACRSLVIAATVMLLSGCSGNHVKKYSGAQLGQEALALVFTAHIEGSQSKITRLDGEELPYTVTRILELAPGPHRFTLFNSPWPQERGGIKGQLDHYNLNPPRRFAVYHLAADLKPGFTYVPVPEKRGTLVEPAERLCLAEEPHQTPTARVNISGELRYPSPDAPLVGCTDREPLPSGYSKGDSNWERIE